MSQDIKSNSISFYLAIAFCLLPVLVAGQIFWNTSGIKPDSLVEILSDAEGKERVNILNKIALVSFNAYPDSCKKLALESIKLSEEMGYQEGIAFGYFNLGNTYFIQDSLTQAIIYYLKAERQYEDLPESNELAILYYILSKLNYDAGRIEICKNYHKKTLGVYKSLSDHLNEILTTNGLACRYWYYDWDSAYYYHDKALALLALYPYDIEYSRTYFFLSMAAIRKADAAGADGNPELESAYFRQSLNYTTKSLDYFQKSEASWLDSIYLLPAIYVNHNVGLWETGNQDSMQLALDYLDKMKYMSDTGNTLSPEYTLVAYYEHARHLKDIGKVREGLKLYETGIKEAEKQLAELNTAKYLKADPYFEITLMSEYRIRLAWAHYWIYKAYERYHDYENALRHFKLYYEANEHIYKKDNEKLIAMLEAESENEKTENLISTLERDRQISALHAVQSRNFNIGLGIMIPILLLLSILFIRQNKIKHEHHSNLLEQKLLRLQMNPHFIFNALSSIHSLMNTKDVTRASDYLGHFSRLLRSNLESSREDYILLENEVNSIKNYLELQNLRFENKFEYTIDIDPEIKLDEAIIPPMLIQPFIENAIEHGIRSKEEKGHIKLKFRLDKQKIICEIEDDGVGREKAWETKYTRKAKHRSLATEIIQDRIRILNRKLKKKISLHIIDLKSDANQSLGTLVRLNLPYMLD